MDFDELKELIRILETSGLSEIEIEEEGRRIRLSKQASSAAMPPMMPYMMAPGAPMPAANPAPAPTAESGELELEPGVITIDSPMVGTFYVGSAPGEPPFVQPNDTVEADQTVCIVEAMKIMNEVVAKQAGIIVKVLAENGESVEFGQPLFTMRPI